MASHKDKYYRQMPDEAENSLAFSLAGGELDRAYRQASQYYAQMKERFIAQITANARIQDANLATQVNQDISKQIRLKALNRADSFQKVQGVYAELGQEISKFISNRSASSRFIQKYKNNIANLKSNEKQNIRNAAYAALPKGAKNRISEIVGQHFGENGLSSTDLYNRFTTYFVEGILYAKKQITTTTAQRIDAMAGYAHELAALEALENAFVKTIHAGPKNVSADVFMTAKGNGSLNEGVKQLKALEQIIEGLNGVSAIGDERIDFSGYFNDLDYFGSQVKLYSVALTGLSRAQGYGVGHRQNLFNTFKAELGKTPLEAATNAQSIRFFNQWNKIVLAMGVNNIVWSTGYAQFWMDEFIEQMHKASYYLQFNRSSSGALTAYVKWGQALTLEAYQHKQTLSNRPKKK